MDKIAQELLEVAKLITAKDVKARLNFDFTSMGGGIDEIYVHPNMRNKELETTFGTYSGGNKATWIKPIEIKLDDEMSADDRFDATQKESSKEKIKVEKEIKKVLTKIDKEIENVMKKLGYKKK